MKTNLELAGERLEPLPTGDYVVELHFESKEQADNWAKATNKSEENLYKPWKILTSTE